MAIIIHSPYKTSVKQAEDLPKVKNSQRLAAITAELHIGGSDGKQPHPDGSPQSVHGGGANPAKEAKVYKSYKDKTVSGDFEFQQGEYQDIISGIKNLPDDLRGFVTAYTPEEYTKKGATAYLSKDKKSGYVLTPEGELISVFSYEKGRGQFIMDSAVSNGAKFLDCYEDPQNEHLTKLYAKFGFVETERYKWDDQYAPEGWDYKKRDHPPVVIMKRQASYDE